MLSPLKTSALFLLFAFSSVQAASRPNVLLVTFDDLRPELGAYGNSVAITPNLDQFAQESVLFSRAYCQQAICMPSRNSFLSGRRPESSGLTGNEQIRTKLPNAVTLPQFFKNRDYDTRSFGKVFHHRDSVSWSQTEFVPAPDQAYYPIYLDPANILTQANVFSQGNAIQLDSTWYNGQYSDYISKASALESASVDDFQHYDGRITQEVLTRLDEVGDEPFFFAVGFYKPHLPFSAPQAYFDLYDPNDLPLPNVPLPSGTPSPAQYSSNELLGYTDINGLPNTTKRRELVHGYYACISYVDALFGHIVNRLKANDQYDDTIIVAFSDHGYHLGEHAMWNKHTNFELTTRVPLIIKYPNMPAQGVVLDHLVELVDLYPTLSQLVGVDPDPTLEGVSLLPIISDATLPWKTGAFSYYSRQGYEGRTMRTDRYRYTEWTKGSSVLRELYDHSIDPNETVNYASDPAYASTVTSLSTQLATHGDGNKPDVYLESYPIRWALQGEAFSSEVRLNAASGSAAITAIELPFWLSLTDHGDGSATLSGTAPELSYAYPVTLEIDNGAEVFQVEGTINVVNSESADTLGYWRLEPFLAEQDESGNGQTLSFLGNVSFEPVGTGIAFPQNISLNGLSNQQAAELNGLGCMEVGLSSAYPDGAFSVDALIRSDSLFTHQIIAGQYHDRSASTQTISFDGATFLSYGNPNQDISGTHSVSEDGHRLTMNGNTWKAIPMNRTITANTVLEFDLTSVSEGEILVIGFDTDLDHDNLHGGNNRMFQVGGSATWSLANNAGDGVQQYQSTGGKQHFSIPVGQFYTGAMTYFVVGVDDDANTASHAIWENIILHEGQGNEEHWQFYVSDTGLLSFDYSGDGENVYSHHSSLSIVSGDDYYAGASVTATGELTYYLQNLTAPGALQTETTTLSPFTGIRPSTVPLTFGANQLNGNLQHAFHGFLDELRIHSGALSPYDLLIAMPPDFSTYTAALSLSGEDALEMSDPDKDGVLNLMEFVMGEDATTPGGHLLSIDVEAGNHESLFLEFPWRKGIGESFDVQRSTNLSNWAPVSNPFRIISVEDDPATFGLSNIRVEVEGISGEETAVFYQLRVQ